MSLRGFATVVFGDSFKITNIAILENAEKGQLFVSMPRYKTNERDESGGYVYKDVCNPITKEFREKLYQEILEVYEKEKEKQKEQSHEKNKGSDRQGVNKQPPNRETPFR